MPQRNSLINKVMPVWPGTTFVHCYNCDFASTFNYCYTNCSRAPATGDEAIRHLIFHGYLSAVYIYMATPFLVNEKKIRILLLFYPLVRGKQFT